MCSPFIISHVLQFIGNTLPWCTWALAPSVYVRMRGQRLLCLVIYITICAYNVLHTITGYLSCRESICLSFSWWAAPATVWLVRLAIASELNYSASRWCMWWTGYALPRAPVSNAWPWLRWVFCIALRCMWLDIRIHRYTLHTNHVISVSWRVLMEKWVPVTDTRQEPETELGLLLNIVQYLP